MGSPVAEARAALDRAIERNTSARAAASAAAVDLQAARDALKAALVAADADTPRVTVQLVGGYYGSPQTRSYCVRRRTDTGLWVSPAGLPDKQAQTRFVPSKRDGRWREHGRGQMGSYILAADVAALDAMEVSNG